MLRKIPNHDVELGMFIVGFGGTWFDHPFWRGKFVIESTHDLERVRRSSVPYVVIDEARGLSAATDQAPDQTRPSAETSSKTKRRGPRKARYRPAIVQDPRSLVRRNAIALATRSKETMRRVFGDAEQGWAVDRSSVDGVLDGIVASIEEDAKTLLSVTRLKTKDDYTYLHSVAVCTLMVCIAKRRGMDDEEVRDLGLAGLLHDIGKIGIPDPILKKPHGLSGEELAVVRNHPEHGFRLLSQSPGISDTALDVCRHHHEKIDGSGYPFGLAESEISFAARLGAVCDVFDALTSHRPYKGAWSSQKALTRMWGWEGHFDRSLLEELMKTLHVYADGILVRLSNKKLALTLTEQPGSECVRAAEIFCLEHGERIEPRRINIVEGDPDLQIMSIEDPANWGFDDWEYEREQIIARL